MWKTAARAMRLQIQIFQASTRGEIHAAFDRLARERPDALFVGGDPLFTVQRVQLATLTARPLHNALLPPAKKLSPCDICHRNLILEELNWAIVAKLAHRRYCRRGSLVAMPSSTTSTAIVSRLPERLSAQLFAGAKSCHLRAGDTLFAAGDSGDGCYRLERDLLKVRSASVIAVKDCELSFISQKNVEKWHKTRAGYLSIPGERAGVIDGRRRARKREQALSDRKRRGLVTRSSGFYSPNDNTTLKRYAADEGSLSRYKAGEDLWKEQSLWHGR
jgi:hypothetical protein